MPSIVNDAGLCLELLEGDERAQAMLDHGGSFNPISDRIWSGLRTSSDWTMIIDVGANYGEMILSRELEPGVRAIAFEPNERIAACLRKSIAKSGSDIEVLESAVGDTTGETIFFADPRWSGTSTATESNRPIGANEVRVPAVRLDQFLLGLGIGNQERLLLKIDIEGGERAALSGLLAVLPLFKSFAIQVEILHSPIADIEWILDRFILHLVHLEFDVFVPVATLDDYRRLVATGDYYEQDAVLSHTIRRRHQHP